jgi:hypothetical protein
MSYEGVADLGLYKKRLRDRRGPPTRRDLQYLVSENVKNIFCFSGLRQNGRVGGGGGVFS